jgi:hypothetical protein
MLNGSDEEYEESTTAFIFLLLTPLGYCTYLRRKPWHLRKLSVP